MIHSLQTILNGVQAANILTIAHHTSFITLLYLTNSIRVLTANTPFSICNDPFVKTLIRGLITIIGVLRALGVAIAVHGIVMGGLTRILSFGNERRISESNRAIIEAVVGLIIVLLGVTLGNEIPTWFGLANHTCPIGPEGSSIPG
jgi:hypothetical protein